MRGIGRQEYIVHIVVCVCGGEGADVAILYCRSSKPNTLELVHVNIKVQRFILDVMTGRCTTHHF